MHFTKIWAEALLGRKEVIFQLYTDENKTYGIIKYGQFVQFVQEGN